MTKTILTVSTCPRADDASYVEATLRSLDLAGADLIDEKFVVSDGPFDRKKLPEPTSFGSWNIIEYAERSTSTTQVMWRILDEAVKRDADQIIYVEDDVKMVRNAIARILQVGVPDDCILTTFFDTIRFNPKTPYGLYKLPVKHYLSNQCFLMPRRSIDFLLRVGHAHFLSDVSVSWNGMESPWLHYLAHVPCLVEHTGAVSVANEGMKLTQGRRASRWDPNLDAQSLPPPDKIESFNP